MSERRNPADSESGGAEDQWDPALWCMPGIGHDWGYELVGFNGIKASRIAYCKNGCGWTESVPSAGG